MLLRETSSSCTLQSRDLLQFQLQWAMSPPSYHQTTTQMELWSPGLTLLSTLNGTMSRFPVSQNALLSTWAQTWARLKSPV